MLFQGGWAGERGTAEEAGPGSGGTTRVPARAPAGLSAYLCMWWAESTLSLLGAGREKVGTGARARGGRREETASRLQEMLRLHCPHLRRQDSVQVEAGLNVVTSLSVPLGEQGQG